VPIARSAPPVRPALPQAWPANRAEDLRQEAKAAGVDPIQCYTTLDGITVNLPGAIAQSLAASIRHQSPILCVRGAGYVRKDIHLSLSVIVEDCIRIVRLSMPAEEAAKLTMLQLHNQLLAQFWDELDAPEPANEA